MDGARAKELLSRLMEVLADRIELDGALELFKHTGFTDSELADMGYIEDEAED